jgi:hypothetical protein
MVESHKSVHCVTFQVGNGFLPSLSSFLLHSSCMSLECLGTSYLENINEKINSKNRFVKLILRQIKGKYLRLKTQNT